MVWKLQYEKQSNKNKKPPENNETTKNNILLNKTTHSHCGPWPTKHVGQVNLRYQRRY